MKENPTWLPVVAAALLDGRGRVLMHRRPREKAHGGLWEFPGGKVEPEETPVEALGRELLEELGIRVDLCSAEPAAFAQSQPGEDGIPIVILLYTVTEWTGEPVALEGGACQWFAPSEAALLDKPPLDVRLFELILPRLSF